MAGSFGLGVTIGAASLSHVDRCLVTNRANSFSVNNNNEGAPQAWFLVSAAASGKSAGASSSSSLQVNGRKGHQLPSLSPWRGERKKKERVVAIRMSVDVDDNAAAEEAEGSSSKSKTEEELIKEATEELQNQLNSRRGLEERYLVINSGKNECRSCGYVYNSEKGDPNYPIPGGVAFSDLPTDWRCPTCGAAQSYFQSKGVEVAGFVQNQNYGLGGNSMTEGQKSLLIYGSLVFFFALFLAGYLLQ
ncbi:unnamed protein product [Calypogeia fissa]